MHLHFIITGGTIDSHYDGTKDTAVPSDVSVIPQFIKSLKLYKDCSYTDICMKDSRDLNAQDIKRVLETAEKSPHTKIIITHGTYTMPDTAKYLKENLKRKDQTIILTGSMIPLGGFTMSDGGFNLGYAVAQMEHLQAGVYVCMNGEVLEADKVKKDVKEGRFVGE